MTLGPIGFAAPWLLVALAALPILWIILRAVPPAPIRRRFPGVALLLGLQDEESVSDRTPWWLLLLRMLAVAAIIVGLAGPILNPQDEADTGNGPLLIVMDGSWASARDWDRSATLVDGVLAEAGRQGRTAAILRLSEEVDPEEAARAARIAISYPLELRDRYGVTDPPLIHNTKVNMGLRPRGLCWHWADDLEARLAEEGFATLEMHRAIANATSLLIDHSTVVLSARGEAMEEGIVLDGWRRGGDLFWSPVREDPRYKWERRADVFARRR